MKLKNRLCIWRKATVDDLDLVTNIEATCFPPAEAASREAFKERLKYYAGQFLIAFDGDTPIGFIDGFVSDDEILTDQMLPYITQVVLGR